MLRKNFKKIFSGRNKKRKGPNDLLGSGDESASIARVSCAGSSDNHQTSSSFAESDSTHNVCDLKDVVIVESMKKPVVVQLSSNGEVLMSSQAIGNAKGLESHELHFATTDEEMQASPSKATSSADMFDDAPTVVKSYDTVPLIEQTALPRGGISMETKAVGRVQFGIPPETIKDSMRLGLSVPAVYIVPEERFCREMGPALGVNLAEFEFPAYFNFFVYKKRCTLIVDSDDAERNIRRVFSETLLGPAQFRRAVNPIAYEEEDFAPDFPREAIPNFEKELKHFRTMPDGNELVLETLLNFCHFESPAEGGIHENLGIPPPLPPDQDVDITGLLNDIEGDDDDHIDEMEMSSDLHLVDNQDKSKWTYSQARWMGDVATIFPPDATPEQMKARNLRRVEIFKMPGGIEYILHDVDENNHIVGKARFAGHVKVSESMSVDGFGGNSFLDDAGKSRTNDDDDEGDGQDSDSIDALDNSFAKNIVPPTFHPPSFGVTVLGNSHGFDKSGSVSGYVLWINGRGVMIDPPPYSSATLEREGIRPRTIVGIILTHCHADHDAGAFQKVLTGSPVVVITTPTIYKSFIRKYAALSALVPGLLRHSHRHKPAIIGAPLRFQGATFHFTYSLHTIPCIGFRVEWRGRSMVFTGDHFNSPPAIDMLQEQGVLSKGRADDLRNLPLQETDLLLHEAGAPPIHTPLDVLLKLPQRVKRRLYVVHTSSLPEGCELRVAPTGTAGTIRLDQMVRTNTGVERALVNKHPGLREYSISHEDDEILFSPWGGATNEYEPIAEGDVLASEPGSMSSSFGHLSLRSNVKSTKMGRSSSLMGVSDQAPPLVSLRPASSTDAWFILNLLSAVPFLTSLSYASTMELLETARVDAYYKGDVIVPSSRRNAMLCVVWEGTCVERDKNVPKSGGRGNVGPLLPILERHDSKGQTATVWYAGDWTGPIALQPEKHLSGESASSSTHDVVAMSSEGVKVITVEFSNLHAILKSGSALYRKYLERRALQQVAAESTPTEVRTSTTEQLLNEAMRELNVLELVDCNSALRKLTAVQKRHLESLAEGPISYQPGERMWRAGTPVDKAFIIVSGTALFLPKRRNGGSVGMPPGSKLSHQRHSDSTPNSFNDRVGVTYPKKLSIGESMRIDAITAIRELGDSAKLHPEYAGDDSSIDSEELESRKAKGNLLQLDALFCRTAHEEDLASALTETHDYAKLSRGLQKLADNFSKTDGESSDDDTGEVSIDGFSQYDNTLVEPEGETVSVTSKDRRLALARRRSSRARFANKVLGRLYTSRAFTSGLVFTRGHFIGDIAKMVAGLVSSDAEVTDDDTSGPRYGFGFKPEGGASSRGHRESLSDMVIHEQEGGELIVHSTTLTAGKDGCVVLLFPKASLIPFLDEYPGLLLSLLGRLVVV